MGYQTLVLGSYFYSVAISIWIYGDFYNPYGRRYGYISTLQKYWKQKLRLQIWKFIKSYALGTISRTRSTATQVKVNKKFIQYNEVQQHVLLEITMVQERQLVQLEQPRDLPRSVRSSTRTTSPTTRTTTRSTRSSTRTTRPTYTRPTSRPSSTMRSSGGTTRSRGGGTTSRRRN